MEYVLLCMPLEQDSTIDDYYGYLCQRHIFPFEARDVLNPGGNTKGYCMFQAAMHHTPSNQFLQAEEEV